MIYRYKNYFYQNRLVEYFSISHELIIYVFVCTIEYEFNISTIFSIKSYFE